LLNGDSFGSKKLVVTKFKPIGTLMTNVKNHRYKSDKLVS
jgi:hypothetical protein